MPWNVGFLENFFFSNFENSKLCWPENNYIFKRYDQMIYRRYEKNEIK